MEIDMKASEKISVLSKYHNEKKMSVKNRVVKLQKNNTKKTEVLRDISDLSEKAYQLRHEMLEMCIKAGDGHVTSSLSCAEILTILYYGGFLKHDLCPLS